MNGKEELLLLGVIDKSPSKVNGSREIFSAYADDMADVLEFKRPPCIEVSEWKDALAIIETLNPWEKGIIVRDSNNRRVRVGNPRFKHIHRLFAAEDNFTKKQLIKMFLTGASDAISAIEPKYNEPLKLLNKVANIRFRLTQEAYDKAKDAGSQKEFADAVNHSLLSYILFNVRKRGPINRTEFIQAIKPRLVEEFLKNIGELHAFDRAIEKARGSGETIS